MTSKETEMSAKPETQSERAELIERLNALSELCGMATGGWDLPDSATARISSIASKAAALLAADGKAGGEVVGYLPAHELSRLNSGHDANLRSAKFGPSALDGDIPVFTRPQQAAQVAQPLTPERIMEIAREAGFNLEPTANWLYTVRGNAAQVINAIRLTEAAHGIGKDQAS